MAALAIQAVLAGAQGMPFIRNYTAAEYKGHNQNFDIITGEDGTVYVANFEGLLYYDNAQWRMIHAKGITRITAIFRDSKGRIWTGGYNYLGYLTSNSNGRLELVALDEGRHIQGEVTWIWENNNTLSFLMGDGDIYTLHDHKIVKDKNAKVITGLKRISKPGLRIYAGAEELPKVLGGLGIAIVSTNKGVMTDKAARKLNVGGEVLAYIW